MHLVFLSKNMKFSGGRKLLFEYASFLQKEGHDVEVLIQEKRGSLLSCIDTKIISNFSYNSIPECDIIIATTPKEVLKSSNSGKGKVVHFCQGFQIIDLEQRIKGESLPARYQNRGVVNFLKVYKKRRSWQRKAKQVDRIYRLPTYLITISLHLKKLLEKRYKRPVYLCRNGVHQEFFYPDKSWKSGKFTERRPLRVINVGPYNVTCKGIPDTLRAIECLKREGFPIQFVRVSPKISGVERDNPVIDEAYENISQKELGKLFRSCDVYISNSTEGEGFGLPAMEALSSGLLCILSSISSCLSFSDRRDFCFFVPEKDPASTSAVLREIIAASSEKFFDIRKNALEIAAHYSHEKACKNFEKILEHIMKSKTDS